MNKSDDYLDEIYNNILKPNSDLYSIPIDELFELLLNYKIENSSTTYPKVNPNDLNKNDIMMGVDNYAYIVKLATNDTKYWKRINKM